MKRLLTVFLLTSPLSAEPKPADPDKLSVSALIGQLAAPKVRLRDEAQAILTEMPEAEAELRAALDSPPGEEARIRLKRILKDLRDQAWQLRWDNVIPPGPHEDAVLRDMVISPDGTIIAAASIYGVDLFNAADGNYLRRVGSASEYANEPGGTRRSIAFSPDGSLIASMDMMTQIFIDKTDGTRVKVLPPETVKRMVNMRTQTEPGSSTFTITQREVSMTSEVWGLAFLEGKRLAAWSAAGLIIHDLDGGERKLLPVAEIFIPEGFSTAPRGLGISADHKTIAVGLETMGGKDRAALVRVSDLTVIGNWQLPAIPCCLAVNRTGTEVLVGLREGGVFRCTVGESAAAPLHRIGGWVCGLDYAPDEKSAVLSSSLAAAPLRLIALPSGETLWTAPAAAQGFEDAIFSGPDRIMATGHDNTLRSWNRRTTSPAQPASN